jgi:hypothetical protein
MNPTQITVVTLTSGTFTVPLPKGTSYTDYVRASNVAGGIWNGQTFYPWPQIVSVTAS